MPVADNIKEPSLSNSSHCNCNNTIAPHCFSLLSVPWLYHCTVLIKLTAAVLHCIRLLFYRPRQCSISNSSSILPVQPLTGHIVTFKNVFTRNWDTKITSSVNLLPLYDHFPTVVCLFKNLASQVAINLGMWPMTSDSLFKIFRSRSMAHFVWTWSGFGLTMAIALTSISFVGSCISL